MAEDSPRRKSKSESDTKAEEKAEGSEGKRKKMPDYKMEAVDELPAGVESGVGRSKLYFNLLTRVLQEGTEDQWYEIADFRSHDGAATAARELTKGERDIPDGNWEFKGIRLPEGNSKLFVRLNS